MHRDTLSNLELYFLSLMVTTMTRNVKCVFLLFLYCFFLILYLQQATHNTVSQAAVDQILRALRFKLLRLLGSHRFELRLANVADCARMGTLGSPSCFQVYQRRLS